MKNKVNLSDIGKKEDKNIQTSFKFDKKEYVTFKKNLKEYGLKVTEVFSEFIRRVNEVFKDGGGEVVFGIEPNKKEGDKK